MTEAPRSLTFLKRVRPAGLLKGKKPIHLLTWDLKVGQFAPIAQLVRAELIVRRVTGSSPVGRTIRGYSVKGAQAMGGHSSVSV